jgi:hypothetical protein
LKPYSSWVTQSANNLLISILPSKNLPDLCSHFFHAVCEAFSVPIEACLGQLLGFQCLALEPRYSGFLLQDSLQLSKAQGLRPSMARHRHQTRVNLSWPPAQLTRLNWSSRCTGSTRLIQTPNLSQAPQQTIESSQNIGPTTRPPTPMYPASFKHS